MPKQIWTFRQPELPFTHKQLHSHSFLYLTRLCVAWLVWVGCIPTQEVLRISESEFLLSVSPNLSPNLLKTLECRCSWPSNPTGHAPFQSSVTFLVPIYFLYLRDTEHKYHTTLTQTSNQYLLHHCRTPNNRNRFLYCWFASRTPVKFQRGILSGVTPSVL
jgi:hypothetical protein